MCLIKYVFTVSNTILRLSKHSQHIGCVYQSNKDVYSDNHIGKKRSCFKLIHYLSIIYHNQRTYNINVFLAMRLLFESSFVIYFLSIFFIFHLLLRCGSVGVLLIKFLIASLSRLPILENGDNDLALPQYRPPML